MSEPSCIRAFIIIIGAMMCLRNIDDHPHSDSSSGYSSDDTSHTHHLGQPHHHHHSSSHHHEDHIPYAPRLISRHIA
ncbi:hypothetical protein BFW01_g1380 [Lasiodiplodia theobromae]|uniref:Uncharacterized protein n=1 Tax=Lasiodiplodia theobromae TaxID=45133 RepID=A0A8H7MC43_9PEZI|nr:Transcription factor TFIIIC Tau55-related protein [Lasiodiplodia theobromae]KAF4536294.1 Transcription factor TFIIIC Tau55-related protein [Lasiodiplodia theobromae]KAF9630818.1 hypothetical protein BFW01_g1380 [Lasiodiplodia theobromae]